MGVSLLNNRVVLVTGAARGLGQQIACRAAEEGARVAITDRDPKGLENTEALLHQLGADTLIIEGCLTDTTFPEKLIDACDHRFGQLDCLVNNAGIEHRASIADHTLEAWDKVIAVNLTAPFLISQAALRLLKESDAPAIVNIASTAVTGFKGQPAYDTSKGGVLSMTRSLAVDLSEFGIRVNAVCPGFIETEMIASDPELSDICDRFCRKLPAGRPGKPREIAAAVIWLASGESSYVTGQGIFVDGGWVRS